MRQSRKSLQKRRIDGIRNYLEKLDVMDWEEKIHNREEWKEMVVKTFMSYNTMKKKKERLPGIFKLLGL